MSKRTYHFNESYFEKIDTSEKAYWLGFLYADGYITTRNTIGLTLSSKDRNHIALYLKAINHPSFPKETTGRFNEHFPITEKSYGRVYSAKMHMDLQNQGLFPRKSLILKFPTENQVPKKYQRDFIRGYFDGDGCVGVRPVNKLVKGNVIRYSRPVVELLGTRLFLTSLLEVLNCNAPVYSDKRSNSCRTLLASKVRTKLFYEFCYYPNCFCLKRKQEIFEKALGCGLPIFSESD